MPNFSDEAKRVGVRAERAAQQASPWVKSLARAGYAAKGVLYCTIGLLAALAAWGDGDGRTTDSKGALREIQAQPFGQVLLVLMAVGLSGYALWCFIQALLDPEHDAANKTTGIFMRIGRFVAGLLHAALVVYAIGLITGAALGGAEGAKSWTARLMAWDPAGVWIVGGVGVVIAGFAVHQMYKAWMADLDEQLSLGRLEARTREIVVEVSRVGLAARAVVFAIVGACLVIAALEHNPGEARGLGEALRALQEQSFGGILLGTVAIGLLAYGLFEFLRAGYRRIQPV